VEPPLTVSDTDTRTVPDLPIRQPMHSGCHFTFDRAEGFENSNDRLDRSFHTT
jgi:hypothetical protein